MKPIEECKEEVAKLLHQGVKNGYISQVEMDEALKLTSWPQLQPILDQAQGIDPLDPAEELKQVRAEKPLMREDFNKEELEKLKACRRRRPLTSFVPPVVTRAPAMLLSRVVPYGINICRLPARSLAVVCGSRQCRAEIHGSLSPEAPAGFPDGGRFPSGSCSPLRPFHSKERLVTRISGFPAPFRHCRDRY